MHAWRGWGGREKRGLPSLVPRGPSFLAGPRIKLAKSTERGCRFFFLPGLRCCCLLLLLLLLLASFSLSTHTHTHTHSLWDTRRKLARLGELRGQNKKEGSRNSNSNKPSSHHRTIVQNPKLRAEHSHAGARPRPRRSLRWARGGGGWESRERAGERERRWTGRAQPPPRSSWHARARPAGPGFSRAVSHHHQTGFSREEGKDIRVCVCVCV
jgi:hypothetical protein